MAPRQGRCRAYQLPDPHIQSSPTQRIQKCMDKAVTGRGRPAGYPPALGLLEPHSTPQSCAHNGHIYMVAPLNLSNTLQPHKLDRH